MTRFQIRTVSAVVLFLIVVAGVTGVAEGATTGGFELRRGSLTGSGGQSSGGAFTARTTTSQPDAGAAVGGVFGVTGSIAKGNPADCTALASASGVFASGTFCAGVRVSWIDNSNHESGYRIRRNSVELAITAPDVTVYDDSTAVPGVAYSYVVVTKNNCGDADPSGAAIGHRPLPPAAPTNLQVSGVRSLSDSFVVNLSWNDNSADEVSQAVYRVDSTRTLIQTLPPDVHGTQVTVADRGASPQCFAVAAANCGLEAVSDTTCIVIPVGVPGDSAAQALSLPTAFALGPFAPNPFSQRVLIAFDVPRAAPLKIRVYDVSGRLLRSLREGVFRPGRYAVAWDGSDGKGQSAASGIYFIEMRAPGYRKINRLTRLR